jgi:hypothetical protein
MVPDTKTEWPTDHRSEYNSDVDIAKVNAL